MELIYFTNTSVATVLPCTIAGLKPGWVIWISNTAYLPICLPTYMHASIHTHIHASA